MSSCQKAARPLTRCLQLQSSPSRLAIRTLTSSPRLSNELVVDTAGDAAVDAAVDPPIIPKPPLDPATVTSSRDERKLMRLGILPIGSRRRRAAMKAAVQVPFEQLPFQCFQEARNILTADREEKLKEITTQRLRIANLVAQDAAVSGGEQRKQARLQGHEKHLEWLKIQADINDPLVKKRFEDNQGDMNKPIYRYYADRKWREMKRKITMQRIQNFSIVPDVLPHFEPTAQVDVAFRNRNVQPGDFIDSRVSEGPARLKVQVFDKGERLVSVVVVDSDVPSLKSDDFSYRCHYLATNIPISPTQTSLPLSHVTEPSQLVLPWLPPYAQKGSPYHRYSIFVLQQSGPLDAEQLRESTMRKGFKLRTFVQHHDVQPIGVGIFRAQFDEGTVEVMKRARIGGWEMEFKRVKIPALKLKEKAKGWEARHSSDKYKPIRKSNLGIAYKRGRR